MSRRVVLRFVLLLLLAGGVAPALAEDPGESSQTFGAYTVHYSAFTADTLPPSMAKAYGVTRSKNRAVLTLSVLKQSVGPTGTAVRAKVVATATNLTGQLKKIDLREIDEGTGVYYLAEFPVAHEEVLDFRIKVTPEGEDKTFEVRFRRRFYTQ